MIRAAIVSGCTLVVLAAIAVACGSKDDAKDEDSTTAAIKFSDVAPIIKASCTDGACHGKTGAQSKIYEDNEAEFKASANAPLSTKVRFASTEAGIVMPRAPSTISAADKQKLLDFLAQ